MAAVVVERKQDQTNLTDCGECLWRMDLGMCVCVCECVYKESNRQYFFPLLFFYTHAIR